MITIDRQTLIIICGWPISGKSTIAEMLARELGIRHLDIDEHIRFPIFGKPDPYLENSPEQMGTDAREMDASYHILASAAHETLALGRSVILTATCSKTYKLDILLNAADGISDVAIKTICCIPQGDSREEIESRISQRGLHTVNTWKRYLSNKEKYQPIQNPHLKLDTGPAHQPEDNVQIVLDYLEGSYIV